MLTPKKHLGQNFLRDENVLRNIIASGRLLPGQRVVEIGPGNGALTRHLIDAGADMTGVEIDERAVALLREQFGDRLHLMPADVLTTRLKDLPRMLPHGARIFGNIPYYITSEILFWMYGQHEWIADATLMMQLEVARRLTAPPSTKEYGILTVLTQFHAIPSLLFRVSRNSFHPIPNVDSAVVHLEFLTTLSSCNRSLLTNIVRVCFGQRRKTLRNGLRRMGFSDDHLAALPVDLSRRPETLTLDEFVALTKRLEPFLGAIVLPFHTDSFAAA